MDIRNKFKDQTGFTIIEVMIVLAIAAVIMLIVFLAVPALQRNSRNTQRNDDAARIASAVNECLANRNGQTTSCDSIAAAEIALTFPNDFSQLQTAPAAFATTSGTCATGSTTQAAGCYNTNCNADGTGVVAGSSTKQFVIRWQNENNIQRCFAS